MTAPAKGEVRRWCPVPGAEPVVSATDYATVVAERDALMADAARYRFLCNRAEQYTTEYDCVFFTWKVGPRTIYIPPSKQDVDAAIDAVMEHASV